MKKLPSLEYKSNLLTYTIESSDSSYMSEISDSRHISDSNDNINNSEINYFVMTKNVMNKKCDKEEEKTNYKKF